MKIVFLIFLSLFSSSVTLRGINAGDPPVEFCGYMKFDGTELFSLRCTEGRGSAWKALGEKFYEGCLVEYDSKSKILVFSNQKGTFNVAMVQSHGLSDSISDQNFAHDNPSNTYDDVQFYSSTHSRDYVIRGQNNKSFLNDTANSKVFRSSMQQAFTNSHQVSIPNNPNNLKYVPGLSGPTNPKVTTALTRKEKIAAGRIGYAQ